MRLFSFFSSLISKHSILYEPCNQTISFSLDKSVINIRDPGDKKRLANGRHFGANAF